VHPAANGGAHQVNAKVDNPVAEASPVFTANTPFCKLMTRPKPFVTA